MIIKNKLKRRNFFGYVMGGLAGTIFSLNPASLFAKGVKILRPAKKIEVKENPLAVPREKRSGRVK